MRHVDAHAVARAVSATSARAGRAAEGLCWCNAVEDVTQRRSLSDRCSRAPHPCRSPRQAPGLLLPEAAERPEPGSLSRGPLGHRPADPSSCTPRLWTHTVQQLDLPRNRRSPAGTATTPEILLANSRNNNTRRRMVARQHGTRTVQPREGRHHPLPVPGRSHPFPPVEPAR